jgi:predicted RNA-binding Zn ribbon-like protein
MFDDMPTTAPAPVFLAGELWLDFVDTEGTDLGVAIELIPDVESLLDWLVAAGALDRASASEARRRWGTGARGAALLRAAHDLRAVLRGLGERLAAGDHTVLPAERAAINAVLATRPTYPQLVARRGRVSQHAVAVDRDAPEQILAAIAQSAADTLTAGDLRLVKRCEEPRCTMLFYDTTKNHARRFCSAAVCGNRAKAAARYERIRASRAAKRRAD